MNPTKTLLYETNDCTVQTLSVCLNIPYREAHELCESYGRKPREGFHIQAKLLEDFKHRFKILPQFSTKRFGPTLRLLDKTKTYLCIVNHHAFAIKNGVCCDGMDNSHKMVIRLFEVIQ